MTPIIFADLGPDERGQEGCHLFVLQMSLNRCSRECVGIASLKRLGRFPDAGFVDAFDSRIEGRQAG
jgi:hypothetical protein